MPGTKDTNDPREMGYFMPAEWAAHGCCWMGWPCRPGLWSNIEAVAREYAGVANAISRFEPVKMLAPAHQLAEARKLLNPNVEVIEMPLDDSWLRDSGPNFLVNGSGELAGSTWVFNAWGNKYQPYDKDAEVASRILGLAGAREFSSRLVAEGGGVTVDGEGTVITTESCLLNANRNPDWSRAEVEAELCRTLGAEKVIWLPGDPDDAETDGHVDGIAAFVEPGRVVLEVSWDKSNPMHAVGESSLAALRGQTDARGRMLEIEFIQSGPYDMEVWNGECRSYVNAYLANGAVIVPGYGFGQDHLAVETWQKLFPDREILQIQIGQIALGGGGIHCITQQQPRNA